MELLTSVLVSRSNLQEQGVLADREGVCRKGLTSAPASCREYECTAEAHTGGVADVKQIRGVVLVARSIVRGFVVLKTVARNCTKLRGHRGHLVEKRRS
jgi:hypothetical protein